MTELVEHTEPDRDSVRSMLGTFGCQHQSEFGWLDLEAGIGKKNEDGWAGVSRLLDIFHLVGPTA